MSLFHRHSSAPPRIVIIGGGISGLAAAYYLQQALRGRKLSAQVTLLESAGRLGGVIGTYREKNLLLEDGPDTFISDKPWALELCRELGLEKELITTRPEGRGSFVLWKGRLRPVPEGFYLMAPSKVLPFIRSDLLSPAGKLRALAETWLPGAPKEDESVAAFVGRRFGREMLERVAQPMIAGIYSADPEQLSMRATFPRFLEMEKKYGSVIRGLAVQAAKGTEVSRASGPRYGLFMSLRGGLERMVEALAAAIPDVEIRTDCRAAAVLPDRRVVLESGGELKADAVFLALPCPASAALLKAAAPDVSVELSRVPYESAMTVNLVYRRSDAGLPVGGFGFVIPRKENIPFSGCTFSTNKFEGRAAEELMVFRGFIGGRSLRRLTSAKEDILSEELHKLLARLFRLRAKPVFSRAWRHDAVMPQYHVGHNRFLEGLEEKRKSYPWLFLSGNAFGGIGIPDCVRRAKSEAESLAAGLQREISAESPRA